MSELSSIRDIARSGRKEPLRITIEQARSLVDEMVEAGRITPESPAEMRRQLLDLGWGNVYGLHVFWHDAPAGYSHAIA